MMKSAEFIARYMEAPEDVKTSIETILKYSNPEQVENDVSDEVFVRLAIRSYLEEIFKIRKEIRDAKRKANAEGLSHNRRQGN